METIKQRGENDCGAACVAMLAGISYDDAYRLVYPGGRARQTKTKDLYAVLVKAGRSPASDRRLPLGSKPLSALTNDALVFADCEEGGRHWLVWDAESGKLRDPYHRKLKLRLRGYLPFD